MINTGMYLKRLVLSVLIFIVTLSGSSFSQDRLSEAATKQWQEANIALRQNELSRALSLYKRVMYHAEAKGITSAAVRAYEAIALVHKKRSDYDQARDYCRRSIRTGVPTFRAYAIFAQTSYEDGKSYDEALHYCQEGRKLFPHQEYLVSYCDLVENVWRKKVDNATTSAIQEYELTRMEREVIRELNYARTKPAEYARHLIQLREYYSGVLLKQPNKIPVRTNEGVSAVDEAIQYLQRVTPVSALKSSIGMSLAARDHVVDQQKSGQTGHTGGDGSEPFERLERYGVWDGISGENIAYGDESARMIVMQLIIDDGVPSRGHRENIYNPEFRVAGTAIGTHPVYRTMCVITFARKFKDGDQ